jgi:hypothetical protein
MAWATSAVGLVVSPPALIKAQAVSIAANWSIYKSACKQLFQQLRSLVTRMNPLPGLKTFSSVYSDGIGWRDRDLIGHI